MVSQSVFSQGIRDLALTQLLRVFFHRDSKRCARLVDVFLLALGAYNGCSRTVQSPCLPYGQTVWDAVVQMLS